MSGLNRRNLLEGGAWAGMVIGAPVGGVAAVRTEEHLDQNVTSVPSSRPAIEVSHESSSDKALETAAFIGPILLLAAVGAAVGRTIEHYLDRGGRE